MKGIKMGHRIGSMSLLDLDLMPLSFVEWKVCCGRHRLLQSRLMSLVAETKPAAAPLGGIVVSAALPWVCLVGLLGS